jgi:hypothetical protein
MIRSGPIICSHSRRTFPSPRLWSCLCRECHDTRYACWVCRVESWICFGLCFIFPSLSKDAARGDHQEHARRSSRLQTAAGRAGHGLPTTPPLHQAAADVVCSQVSSLAISINESVRSSEKTQQVNPSPLFRRWQTG